MKYKIILILSIFCLSIKSIELKFCDMKSGKPIPFVELYCADKKLLSNENGVININLDTINLENDFKLRVFGYKNKDIVLKNEDSLIYLVSRKSKVKCIENYSKNKDHVEAFIKLSDNYEIINSEDIIRKFKGASVNVFKSGVKNNNSIQLFGNKILSYFDLKDTAKILSISIKKNGSLLSGFYRAYNVKFIIYDVGETKLPNEKLLEIWADEYNMNSIKINFKNIYLPAKSKYFIGYEIYSKGGWYSSFYELFPNITFCKYKERQNTFLYNNKKWLMVEYFGDFYINPIIKVKTKKYNE